MLISPEETPFPNTCVVEFFSPCRELNVILENVYVSIEVRLIKVACMTTCHYFTFRQHNQTSSHVNHRIPAQEKEMTSILTALVGLQKSLLCVKQARKQALQISLALRVLAVTAPATQGLSARRRAWGPCHSRKQQPGTPLSRTPMTVTTTQS